MDGDLLTKIYRIPKTALVLYLIYYWSRLWTKVWDNRNKIDKYRIVQMGNF